MKLNLTRVARKNTDKDGKPLVTKDGRPYVRLGVQCKEYGEKWISFFGAPWNDSWKENMEVEADVKVNGQYLNGSKPDPLSEMTKAIMNATTRITKLEARVDALEKNNTVIPVIQDDLDSVNDELAGQVKDSDLPF